METVARLQTDMAGAAAGPIYFEVIKILYTHWSRKMAAWHAAAEAGEASEEESEAGESSDSDGGDAVMVGVDGHELVRKTGRRRLQGLLRRLELAGVSEVSGSS